MIVCMKVPKKEVSGELIADVDVDVDFSGIH
jgi:hypothetical protein